MPLQQQLNTLGKSKIPFFFMVDYEKKEGVVLSLSKFPTEHISFQFHCQAPVFLGHIAIDKNPISFEDFLPKHEFVKQQMKEGNSFLANLTCETPISCNLNLEEIYHWAKAKYKVLWKDKFVCFSPETFVKINERGRISSFPMKGTISAEVPNAEAVLLADQKELYEHTTIVDLIRNDLSKVAKKVWVERFRYTDFIKKHDGRELIQVSSEIRGELGKNWTNKIGDILFEMLPAGSITGAPKPKTIDIIREAEGYHRGYYTGICGVFDGKILDSAVMIRFIEQKSEGLVFKSGGGITFRSDAKLEYEEMLAKIYVPLIRNH